jgi:2-keto-4-pentenoate hydratase
MTLADILLAARRDAREVVERLGWAPLGRNTAGTNEVMRARLRMPEPILGRSFAPLVEAPARFNHAALLDPIVEAEFLFRLGADLAPRAEPWTEAEVAEAVATVHAGIEVTARFGALPPIGIGFA